MKSTRAGCWLPFDDGGVDGMRRVGDHTWRLIEEIPAAYEQVVDWNTTIAWGSVRDVKLLTPPRARWYCTRCRLIETTDVETPRRDSDAPESAAA